MKLPKSTELADAILSGAVTFAPTDRQWDVPRICPLCARRMVLKIDPFGWEAACSRHGILRSEWLEK